MWQMLRLDLRPEIARYDTSKYHIIYQITSVASLKSQGRKKVKKVEKLTVFAPKIPRQSLVVSWYLLQVPDVEKRFQVSFCQSLVFCKIFSLVKFSLVKSPHQFHSRRLEINPDTYVLRLKTPYLRKKSSTITFIAPNSRLDSPGKIITRIVDNYAWRLLDEADTASR